MAAVGGTGSLVEHAAVDAAVFEYIVRKSSDDLVTVTQTDRTPLALGQNVRVIPGNRARVVPDAASAAITSVRAEVRPVDAPGEETPSAPAVPLQP